MDGRNRRGGSYRTSDELEFSFAEAERTEALHPALDRLSVLLRGTPHTHSETITVMRYGLGGRFHRHHDVRTGEEGDDRPCGPRVMTLLLPPPPPASSAEQTRP